MIDHMDTLEGGDLQITLTNGIVILIGQQAETDEVTLLVKSTEHSEVVVLDHQQFKGLRVEDRAYIEMEFRDV